MRVQLLVEEGGTGLKECEREKTKARNRGGVGKLALDFGLEGEEITQIRLEGMQGIAEMMKLVRGGKKEVFRIGHGVAFGEGARKKYSVFGTGGVSWATPNLDRGCEAANLRAAINHEPKKKRLTTGCPNERRKQ